MIIFLRKFLLGGREEGLEGGGVGVVNLGG